VLLLNTCSIREKAQEKVFSLLGAGVLKSSARCADRRRRLRRQPGGRCHHRRRALRRPGVRPADAAPPARDDRRDPRPGRAAGRHVSFPEIEKFDRLPEPRRTGRAPSSRSWKAAASTAASASCPTRAARKSAGRSTTCWPKSPALARRACARSRCSARTSTPTAARPTTGRSPTSRLLIDYVARSPGIERIRFTTSHPLEFKRAPDRGLCTRAEAGQPPAPAGAERFGPHPRADEARLHGARVQVKASVRLRAVRPDISIISSTSSSASPARPSAISSARWR
jgi:tRNA-2-methylthio-N6-dimethylallyladenosine synthase